MVARVRCRLMMLPDEPAAAEEFEAAGCFQDDGQGQVRVSPQVPVVAVADVLHDELSGIELFRCMPRRLTSITMCTVSSCGGDCSGVLVGEFAGVILRERGSHEQGCDQ